MFKKILAITILTSLYSCIDSQKKVVIKNESIEKWENINVKNLNKCCSGFKESIVGLFVYRNFKKNVRSRVLKNLTLDNNLVEVFEEYSYDKNTFDIVVNGKVVHSFNYNFDKDTILHNEKTLSVLNRGSRDKVLSIFKNSDLDCCNFKGITHPSIILYSKIKIGNKGEIDVLETLTR